MNTTLVNAVPVEVTHLDGTKETVEVRQLSIRQRYKFAELAASDASPEIVAMCVGKPEAWVDTLEDDSYGLLLQKSHELNFQKAVTLVAKDPLLAARLLPMLLRFQALEKARQSFGIVSPAPSPAPASSESAAATGSAAST